MISQSIAHYRITAKLGQGGMGAVYRATDTKLDREVAIKVLPETFACEPERLSRFEREAKALAALNHPNIAAIYGLEKGGDSQALILELVEGEDLSERLKRGPLPVEEALEVCKQIAEALEAAHEKGIVHRDLKPGNIKLLPDGRVKVLDFGLAKVISDTPSTAQGSTALTDSPTVFTQGQATMPGVLLGTAGYMSPEQARGKSVDKRSDIWSFGVVLFECLTGQRLFPGETVTDSVGALLHKEIDWSRLPADTPPTIQLLLRKCLARDRKRRLPDIGAARLDLEQAIADPKSSFVRLSEGALGEATLGKGIPNARVAGLVVVVTLVALVLGWFLKPNVIPLDRELPQPQRIRMSLGLHAPLELDTAQSSTSVRFSRDGSMLAFLAVTVDGASNRLYLRRLDQLEPVPVRGAEDCDDFCFSPDGKWIAFRDRGNNQIKKVPVEGGAAMALCRASERLFGMDWSEDDWIAFAEAAGGIKRVSAARGGDPDNLTTLQDLEYAHRWPHYLPGGTALLFSAGRAAGGDGQLMVQSLPDHEVKPIGIENGHHARYLPSGHLVYMEQDELFAVGFDLQTLHVQGTPTKLVDEIHMGWPESARMDVSPNGTLVYLSKTKPIPTELEWVDREGNRKPALSAGDRYRHQLSPDGRSIICFSYEDRLMLFDLEKGSSTRLNSKMVGYDFPLWTPGGQGILWAGPAPGGTLNIYWQRIDGQEARRVTVSDYAQFPISWRPGRPQLLIFEERGGTAGDLRLMTVSGDEESGWQEAEITDFQVTPAREEYASFSPDGQWVAYTVEEGELVDLYVSRIDRDVRGIKVSRSPIRRCLPVWTRSNELLYVGSSISGNALEDQVYVVECSTDGDAFSFKRAVPWDGGTTVYSMFDYDPKGNRLLVAKLAEGQEVPRHDHVILFSNFDQYVLERLRESARAGRN